MGHLDRDGRPDVRGAGGRWARGERAGAQPQGRHRKPARNPGCAGREAHPSAAEAAGRQQCSGPGGQRQARQLHKIRLAVSAASAAAEACDGCAEGFPGGSGHDSIQRALQSRPGAQGLDPHSAAVARHCRVQRRAGSLGGRRHGRGIAGRRAACQPVRPGHQRRGGCESCSAAAGAGPGAPGRPAKQRPCCQAAAGPSQSRADRHGPTAAAAAEPSGRGAGDAGRVERRDGAEIARPARPTGCGGRATGGRAGAGSAPTVSSRRRRGSTARSTARRAAGRRRDGAAQSGLAHGGLRSPWAHAEKSWRPGGD